MEKNYNYIKLSKFCLILCLVCSALSFILCLLNSEIWLELSIFLILTIYFYLILKTTKYYYNDEKLIVESGIFKKDQKIVPLYRIVNITAQDNIFNFGKIYIKDKGQFITLSNVINSKSQMLKLVEKWENAKQQNIRNEVI